ncbi:SCP2 sterol-binding domain-containing protein [Oleiagrimonas sp.]|jgi:ubiquinone biosynthesis protein UbiJ|uniref:ubiquinone biosynthesis accessory factor UbiJ n=1 Tax=Oleiagrimonas sp. TaxID=2010330 RepID=UPI00261E508B|nr:SCP2 sterol-binding domain-containing protein [Oleiagrimonas sp.]MDA3915235.1 SCP2 sterol-binding domain-containing protein [Oleiagrimonas sp.]
MNESKPLLPRPLRIVAGRALEAALNHAVRLDPETSDRLQALEGRRVDLHLRGPELHVSVRVENSCLRVGPPVEDAQAPGVALRVSASPGSLLAMALRRDSAAASPGQVEIAGDADLARRLEKLARGYGPDFEEAFAQRFGDVLGVPLARSLRAGLAGIRRGGNQTLEDVADWLREESRVAVAPEEMDEFLDDVDALRERAERLEARLNRLASSTEPEA